MDSPLSDMGYLERPRAGVARRGVQSLPIVVDLNVIEHVSAGDRAGGPSFAVNGFHLQTVIPTFHCRVVVAMAFGAHAADRRVVAQ